MTYSNYAGRFGGQKIVHPGIGSVVEVRSGLLYEGHRLRVLDIKGHLYSIAYRVYVDAPDGIETWYWPWDLIFDQGNRASP